MSINVFVFSGNCGSDMEVRHTPNGKVIGSVNIPCKSGWGQNEKTAWITCKILGERAEKLAQYITKGTKVTVSGSFQMDEWEKDGVKHSRPVLIVNDIEWANSQLPAGHTASSAPQQKAGVADDFEDSIPF